MEKLIKGKPLPWNNNCIYIGSKFSKVITENKKTFCNLEQLNYYCKHFQYIGKCRELLEGE